MDSKRTEILAIGRDPSLALRAGSRARWRSGLGHTVKMRSRAAMSHLSVTSPFSMTYAC